MVYSKVTIGVELMQREQNDLLRRAVEDKLFQESKSEIVPKMHMSEELNEATNSIEYTGEVAVLTKKEYLELKQIEKEYFKLMDTLL